MKFYNTPDRKIVDFIPLVPGQVSMYCCGPTVYNYAHIGNLRCYLFEDILRRTLQYAGFQVQHVMNITDVGHLSDDGDAGEDKMIRSARQQGLSVWQIAALFTDAFFHDTQRLNILRPQIVSKATEHIQQMIALIQRLESRGLTYQSGGNVYFDTTSFPDYGKMALLDRQETPAVARVETDSAKRHPRDFVLWFTQSKFSDQAMVWDSPWGRGYPGWHIECSAMSTHYLGERFDIHCGGIDHIPVHHTNEIAQSEGAFGHSWVNYWLHNEFLLLSKEKMSKSSGEFLTLQRLLDRGYEALDYRFFCLGGHYRSPLVFSWEALDAARNARRNLNEKVAEWRTVATLSERTPAVQAILETWKSALTNDLALPQALAVLWGMVKDPQLSPSEKLAAITEMDQVLGLDLDKIEAPIRVEAPAEAVRLAEARAQARAAKDWAQSDRLRDQLKALGWLVEDSAQGPVLKPLALLAIKKSENPVT